MRTRLGLGRVMVAGGSVVFTFGLSSSAAFAAGGYGPGTPTQPGVTGAYSDVVSAQTVPASGGTATARVNGGVVSVTIPAGDFTSSVQVVFIAGTAPTSGVSGKPELAFGVQIDDSSGNKLAGPFPNPIEVSVTDPSITAGGTVNELTSSGYTPVTGWTVKADSASGSFTVDVDYLITSAPAVSPIGGATTATTGKPFLGEGILAAGLLALGGLGAWRWRRMRANPTV